MFHFLNRVKIMQTSDQSSEEKRPHIDQTADATDHEQETSSSSSISSEQLEHQKTDQKTDRAAENEAIRRGLIYPPPPAFYEEMSPLSTPIVSTDRVHPQTIPTHPLQSIPETSTPSKTISRNPWQTPPPQSNQYPRTGYPLYPQGQNYAGTQAPPFVVSAPPKKKPRKWILITFAAIAAVMLLSCGLCAWVGVPIFEQVYTQAYSVEVNGLQVVNDYYSDLQNKQYAQAYRDLSTQGALKNISQAEFIAQAEKQDNLYGPVLRYTPGQPDLNNYDGSAISTFPIKVDIARTKQSYTAQLQLTKVDNQWKISNFNHL
jgi:hypothetical protein